MNIPTIEELDRIGCAASNLPEGISDGTSTYQYLTAIREAVVAACRPQLRPIAEMPIEVPEGCERIYAWNIDKAAAWGWSPHFSEIKTHFIDIALPVATYPADFEQAFAESRLDAKDKEAAFKLWQKGGAR